MGRNRKKHKKKIKSDVKQKYQVVSEIDVPVVVKKSVSIDWSKVKIMPTGRGRRGPIYV